MSVFSRLSPLFGTPVADETPDPDDNIHPNGEVALAELKKKAASPNTVINMGPVQEQAARNASRRRANEWARQMRNETESNPALAAEMRKRMANIAAAQTADRNSNAARRAANTAGPRSTGGPILRKRLTERKNLPLSTVLEVNEMNGGRRKSKSKSRKSKSNTAKSKKSRRHK